MAEISIFDRLVPAERAAVDERADAASLPTELCEAHGFIDEVPTRPSVRDHRIRCWRPST